MASYSFTLRFQLKEGPSERLLNFIQPERANIVFPAQTSGGSLVIKGTKPHRLVLRLPLLECGISFPVEFEDQKHWYKPSIYNLACCFSSFIILHTIDKDEVGKDSFVIQLITSNKQHYDLVNTIYQYFNQE